MTTEPFDPDDGTMDDAFLEFLNFGAGVLSLVCLTCSVIWGLVAQDRMILNTRQRIIAQAIHRVTAVASMAFLLVHIIAKLALEHTSWIAAVIPFGLLVSGGDQFAGTAFLIGLGTLAGMLMIFVGITGALRNRFASPAPVAARWRAMHMLAYPAWCAALVHGLFAGRPAKPFFMLCYELCVVGVAAALALRAAPRPFKRKVADQITRLIGNGEPAGREELDASRARSGREQGPVRRVRAAGLRGRAEAVQAGRPDGLRAPGEALGGPPVPGSRVSGAGVRCRLRGRLPGGLRPLPRAAVLRLRPDLRHERPPGHAADGGDPARRQQRQHVRQLADPVATARR